MRFSCCAPSFGEDAAPVTFFARFYSAYCTFCYMYVRIHGSSVLLEHCLSAFLYLSKHTIVVELQPTGSIR